MIVYKGELLTKSSNRKLMLILWTCVWRLLRLVTTWLSNIATWNKCQSWHLFQAYSVWRRCAVRFESEKTPFPWTGRQFRSAALYRILFGICGGWGCAEPTVRPSCQLRALTHVRQWGPGHGLLIREDSEEAPVPSWQHDSVDNDLPVKGAGPSATVIAWMKAAFTPLKLYSILLKVTTDLLCVGTQSHTHKQTNCLLSVHSPIKSMHSPLLCIEHTK